MKSVFKSRAPSAVALACLLGFGFASGSARAEVFFEVRALLAQHFRAAQRVSFVRVRPDASSRAQIERRLGRALPRDEYVVFVATTGARVDGYAIVDEERGQHELITFATFFDAAGRVTRQEVVAYREPYGDGIRAERFRTQFYGRGAASTFRLGDDIDSVSGATISARSMCAGVQRATLIVDFARRTGARPPPLTASR